MFRLFTLCYIQKNNQTLMLLRNKKANDYHEAKWNGVGGKFELDESPEDCMQREILEETGLIVTKYDYSGLLTFPNFYGDGATTFCFVYKITGFTGDLINSPEGHLEWIDDSKLLDLNLWGGDKVFLPWVLESKKFSAKLIYKAKEFIDYSVVFYE